MAPLPDVMVDACRMVGIHMTNMKMSVFVQADGVDAADGQPLVRIRTGKPRYFERIGQNANGSPDIRVGPIFDEWSVHLRLKWDLDQFSKTDISNLLMRAGIQVGIGSGRPFSVKGAGCGWGTFELG